jgi:hypothetical protein
MLAPTDRPGETTCTRAQCRPSPVVAYQVVVSLVFRRRLSRTHRTELDAVPTEQINHPAVAQ